MKTYHVYLTQTVTLLQTVEAHSPDEAIAAAREASRWDEIGTDDESITVEPVTE